MDYLVHHGILGQKWGIRRYQPYSTVPRGSGEGGKEVGLAARAEKKRQKNIARGEKRLTNRLNYLAKKSKGLDTDIDPASRFLSIKYDQAIKATKEILSNEQRKEHVGKVTKHQTVTNATTAAIGEAFIFSLLMDGAPLAAIPGGAGLALLSAVPVGAAYVQKLINR